MSNKFYWVWIGLLAIGLLASCTVQPVTPAAQPTTGDPQMQATVDALRTLVAARSCSCRQWMSRSSLLKPWIGPTPVWAQAVRRKDAPW